MPTEHEYKYVLSLDIVDQIRWPSEMIRIEQGYLAHSDTMNLRVRKEEESWLLVLKQRINGRQIEIQQTLDDRDGKDLWKVCDRKLRKCRHIFRYGDGDRWDGIKWEVDVFFENPEKVYFVMVEVELPEGAPRPELPFQLRKFLIHEVDLTDNRFSNTNLGNAEYATELLTQLQNGVENDYGNQSTKGV